MNAQIGVFCLPDIKRFKFPSASLSKYTLLYPALFFGVPQFTIVLSHLINFSVSCLVSSFDSNLFLAILYKASYIAEACFSFNCLFNTLTKPPGKLKNTLPNAFVKDVLFLVTVGSLATVNNGCSENTCVEEPNEESKPASETLFPFTIVFPLLSFCISSYSGIPKEAPIGVGVEAISVAFNWLALHIAYCSLYCCCSSDNDLSEFLKRDFPFAHSRESSGKV